MTRSLLNKCVDLALKLKQAIPVKWVNPLQLASLCLSQERSSSWKLPVSSRHLNPINGRRMVFTESFSFTAASICSQGIRQLSNNRVWIRAAGSRRLVSVVNHGERGGEGERERGRQRDREGEYTRLQLFCFRPS